MTSVRSNDYQSKPEDYSSKYSKKQRPTITELVLYEKQKKEEAENSSQGKPPSNYQSSSALQTNAHQILTRSSPTASQQQLGSGP